MFFYSSATKNYQSEQTLECGLGYWVNYPTSDTVTMNGVLPGHLTLTAAQPGWVLVGSRNTSVQVSSLVLSNGAAILGSAFRYNADMKIYQSTTVINPGEACWINVTKACVITLPE
jgi:methyl coenzyme M reductase subunit C